MRGNISNDDHAGISQHSLRTPVSGPRCVRRLLEGAMYKSHFGLSELPFGITPDTSFFFLCPSSQEALNTLLIAARNGEGFIKITGEVGTGKTLLCRKFMATLDDSFVTAYIPNPFLEPRTLMLALADELEIELDKDVDQHQLLKSINQRLLILAGEGKRVLVCLDEAQAIPLESLEALRLLTNLETEKRKLLQIVLFGQPELDRKLQNDAIRQLAQRITFHYHLGPLTKDDLDFYLSHRLNVAGFSGGRLFSRGAVRMLSACSGGIPRLVNILAHKSLMLTYGEGRREVAGRHVRAAARDTVAAKKSWRWRWLLPLAALLVGSSAGWTYFK
jgi:MSHA biogenesis protein MshM